MGFSVSMMGVTALLVVVVAAGIGVLVSLALFRVGPDVLRDLFFLPTGAWRRHGRLAWLAAVIALSLIGLYVTPHGAA